MNQSTLKRPFEVDPLEYPFADRWFQYRDGHVHYLDEGKGPVVLLLHGNPTWSYLYRHVIRALRSECRLIALDYPGFGFSRAPPVYGFTPNEHSDVVRALIESLRLRDIVLVVQDWGGPIGMSYAVEHAANIRGLVVMNSWAWEASLPQKIFSVAMGGRFLGFWLQTRRNFFAKYILPGGIYHKEKITPALRQAYLGPFPTPASRLPTWVFPRQIRKARNWLQQLEQKLSRLAEVPTQILWGQRDEPGFRSVEMRRWQKHLASNETEVLEDASHFVQEDRPERVVASIRRVLERTKTPEDDERRTTLANYLTADAAFLMSEATAAG